MLPEQLGDSLELRRIRADNGFLSVYDVIRWITGQDLNACRMIWRRLLELHPNMATLCTSIKFTPKGRGRPPETPATDAAGIVQIIMVLPGRAADKFRQAAGGVIVRYLGGDPGLAQEIWANRRYQEELAASQQHPARVFGEAVEAEGLEAGASAQWQEQQLIEAQIALTRAQVKKAGQETKLVTLQCVALAQQTCSQLGFQMKSVNPWPKRLLTQRCYRPVGTVAFDAHELWARGLRGPNARACAPDKGQQRASDRVRRSPLGQPLTSARRS